MKVHDATTASQTATGPGSTRTIDWLDVVKAVALLWIVLNHSIERLIGGAFLGNPTPNWPPLSDRFAQLLSPAGHGALGALWAALRDLAWMGDEGVGIFLIVSGLGLAWGLQRASATFDVRDFLRRRLARIFPTWLTAHIAIGLPLLFLGGVSIPVLALSAAGIRFLPQTMYAIVPAWWYVGLLLQFYAVFPLLWRAQRRFGPTRTFIAAMLIGFAARGVGLFTAGAYLDEFSRGSLFISRLPEFAFGVALAAWCGFDANRLIFLLRSRWALGTAAISFIVGNAAALTLGGETVAPLLSSAGAFVLIAAGVASLRLPALRWIGKHSLSLFLVHQAAIEAFVSPAAAPIRGLLGLAIALMVTPFVALALEHATSFLQKATFQRKAFRVSRL